MNYEYIVKYRYKQADGYWTETLTYRHFTNTSIHRKAEKEVNKFFKSQFNEFEIINLSMV